METDKRRSVKISISAYSIRFRHLSKRALHLGQVDPPHRASLRFEGTRTRGNSAPQFSHSLLAPDKALDKFIPSRPRRRIVDEITSNIRTNSPTANKIAKVLELIIVIWNICVYLRPSVVPLYPISSITALSSAGISGIGMCEICIFPSTSLTEILNFANSGSLSG
jgi:hypothetical protein